MPCHYSEENSSKNGAINYQSEWINSETQATEFITDIGAILFKDSRKIQKNLLKTGDLQKWDVPLMIDALKCFNKPTKNMPESNNCLREQQKSFNKLIEVRNQLSHHGGLEIDKKSFEEMWNSVSEALIILGITQDELDKAKIMSLQENKGNIEKAEKLKAEGNLHISQPGLPSKELSTLHSNRSFAYLKLGNYYGAKDDAIGATLLNPNWWRGFGRLGHV